MEHQITILRDQIFRKFTELHPLFIPTSIGPMDVLCYTTKADFDLIFSYDDDDASWSVTRRDECGYTVVDDCLSLGQVLTWIAENLVKPIPLNLRQQRSIDKIKEHLGYGETTHMHYVHTVKQIEARSSLILHTHLKPRDEFKDTDLCILEEEYYFIIGDFGEISIYILRGKEQRQITGFTRVMHARHRSIKPPF